MGPRKKQKRSKNCARSRASRVVARSMGPAAPRTRVPRATGPSAVYPASQQELHRVTHVTGAPDRQAERERAIVPVQGGLLEGVRGDCGGPSADRPLRLHCRHRAAAPRITAAGQKRTKTRRPMRRAISSCPKAYCPSSEAD